MQFFKDERPEGWRELVEPSLSKQDMDVLQKVLWSHATTATWILGQGT